MDYVINIIISHCSFLSWKLSVAFIPLLIFILPSQDITGEIRPSRYMNFPPSEMEVHPSVMSFNVLPACTPPLDYKPQVQEPCLFMCCPSSDFWWHLILKNHQMSGIRKCSSKRLHLGSKGSSQLALGTLPALTCFQGVRSPLTFWAEMYFDPSPVAKLLHSLFLSRLQRLHLVDTLHQS